MEFVNKNTIKLDKEINELDKFVIRFIKILEKHVNYVVVSGYVAILLGRDRATEDIDIITPKTDKNGLKLLYDDLTKNGYWCLNSSDLDDIYEILRSKHSIRFAIEPNISPNVEIKFSKDFYDDIALKNPITVKIGNNGIKTSFLELQIAYKEEVLKNNKDLEDARHIRLVAKGHLNKSLINEYKKELRKKP
ncbi:hypothetical protein HYW19_00800 [Candidatus Woesearchaeota archaeon]|nr:hypothetical protein [Candidatus Woesearchaeota archaeon]